MILIYAQQSSNRLEYTLELLFKIILKSNYRLTTNRQSYENHPGAKINYSSASVQSGLTLRPVTLLFEETIRPLYPHPVITGETTGFFPTTDSVFPFDLLAATFYIATCYEEYTSDKYDLHGRYPAESSLLYRNKLLEKPVVHHWAKLLALKISELWPEYSFPQTAFTCLTTVDIDNAWAYRHKGLIRTCGGFMRDLLDANLPSIRSRFRTITNRQTDPYDSYHFLEETFRGRASHLHLFVLLGNHGKHDKNISHRHPSLRLLIKRLSDNFAVGLHPSYHSSDQPEHLAIEKSRLEQITGKPVIKSRHHFLRMRLPDTYRQLIACGIQEDYTLGYASRPGFRAGLCVPFPFFDIEQNKATNLLLYPLHVMDVTLKDYLAQNPSEAINTIKTLKTEVQRVNGMFISLWHNESLGSTTKWDGWREVFLQAINPK